MAECAPGAGAYAEAFWPGPLALLFPQAPGWPKAWCGDGARVCVRGTSCAIAASLCEAFGAAIVSTSANASGEAPAMSPGEIDPVGIARALVTDLLSGELRQGASTLTQQLVKNYFLTPERTWRRNILEAYLPVLL